MSKISFGTNISSLSAQRRLADSSEQLQKTFLRLSSGQRINSASDDAAGLAISSSLDFSTRVYTKSINNINDGISALSIASGALSSLTGIVHRQLELAEQAANGTFSRTQRLTLQSEANSLVNEFNRIVDTASFNGVNLLDTARDIRLQLGYGDNSFLDVGVGRKLSDSVGTGTFSALSGATMPSGANDTVSADLNGDGKLDMIGALTNGTISVRYGNGDGTFMAVSTITTGGQRYVAVADVDGNGMMDIIHGRNTNGFTVTLQTTSGFSAAVTYSGSGSLVDGRIGAMADVNGDGKMDLVQMHNGASQGVQVFLGNGDGSFYSSATIAATLTYGAASFGDINGDGKMDFIASGNYGAGNGVYAFYGNGDGSFGSATSLGMPGSYGLSALTDLNNDGFLDIVQTPVNSSGVLIKLGNGNGTFKATQTYSDIAANSLSSAMRIVDIDKDGFMDVVGTVWGTGALVTYLGNGDGSFKASMSSYIGAINPLGLALGDFNGDGVEDALLAAGGNTFVLSSDTRQSAHIAQINLSTQSAALNSLSLIREIAERIQQETSSIGASQSRLGFGLNAILARREGEYASRSRIIDTDIASESAELTRQTILQQIGSSVLAQANIQPQLALRLLQG